MTPDMADKYTPSETGETNIGLGGTIKTGVIKDGATALGLDKPRKLNHGERMNNQTLRACINCKYSKIYDDSYNRLILHCQKRQRDMAFCNVCDDWHKDWLDKEDDNA